MSVDVGSPSKALVSDAGDRGVTEKRSGAPSRRVIVLVGLIEVVWIVALIYGTVQALIFGTVQALDFVRELIHTIF